MNLFHKESKYKKKKKIIYFLFFFFWGGGGGWRGGTGVGADGGRSRWMDRRTGPSQFAPLGGGGGLVGGWGGGWSDFFTMNPGVVGWCEGAR